MDFEAFPDELMLLIFSMVEDGLTLLDSVPLVCKRWLRLSRDPVAWSGVRLNKTTNDYQNEMPDTARVLLHAPSLRELNIFFGDSQEVPVLSALRRTQALAQKVCLHKCPIPLDGDKNRQVMKEVVTYLSRCGDHLHTLELGSILLGAAAAADMRVVLERLKSLNLWRTLSSYSGGLAGVVMPRLEHLEVTNNVVHGALGTFESEYGMLVDLLRGAEGSLRSFALDNYCLSAPAPATLHVAVRRCKELRSIRCNTVDTVVLWDLPHLHTLCISNTDIAFLYVEEQVQQIFSEVSSSFTHFLTLREPLRSLRSLEIKCEYCSGWPPRTLVRSYCVNILKAMAPVFANVTSLRFSSLWDEFFPEAVADLLNAMPRLQTVHLGRFPVDVLPKVVALEDMQELSGRLEHAEGQERACVDAIDDFKRQRPHVKTVLEPCVLCNVDFDHLTTTFSFDLISP